jgi:hypothetical protein
MSGLLRWCRALISRSWLVQRGDGGTLDELEQDFAAGHPSTVAVTTFVIAGRHIAGMDDVIAVRPGVDGELEQIPTARRRRPVRDLWFRVRVGTVQVSPVEVKDLIAQLRRAEPIGPEPEEHEHAAA